MCPTHVSYVNKNNITTLKLFYYKNFVINTTPNVSCMSAQVGGEHGQH